MKPAWARFPPPLHLSIPLMVLVFSLGYILVNSLILLRSDVSRTENRLHLEAEMTAERLAQLFRTRGGLHDKSMQREASFLGLDPGVNWAVVCSPELKVLFSTREEWLGKPLPPLVSETAFTLSRDVLSAGSSMVRRDGNHGVIAATLLKSSEDETPSIIMVERDLASPLRDELRHVLNQGLISAVVHLLACVLLWWVLHRFLTSRVRQFLKSTRNLQETGGQSPALEGADEFAEISESLRTTELRFRQLADNVLDVFFIFTLDNRFIYVNRAYETVWGRNIEQLMRDPDYWKQYVLPEHHDSIINAVTLIQNGDSMSQVEYRIFHPDGSIRWVEGRLFPIHESSGKVHLVACLARDITDRRHLEQELLDISERERRRIGHDLHDDLCQRLAAIKLRCEMFVDSLQQGRVADTSSASKVCEQIGEAATLTRNMARGLSPVSLEGEGLMQALEKLAITTASLHDVECSFDCPEPILMGNHITATHVYRIAQELANNAARHAKPTYVHLYLSKEDNCMRLEVINDGAPFSEPRQHGDSGMGLRIIRQRVSAIGGSIQFLPRSKGQTGSVVVCLVPEISCLPPLSAFNDP
jgi:PAS domain S-box-containing protein